MNVYSDFVVETSLGVPVVAQGHKMAVFTNNNGNKLPMIRKINTGSGGANLVTPGEHCAVVDIPLPPGYHSYPISTYNIAEDSAGVIALPKDTVQLTVSKQLIMVPGKTQANYGSDGYTEYNIRVVLFRKCDDYDLLIPTGVFNSYVGSLGQAPDPGIVCSSIEADTEGTTTPYSLFREGYVADSVIDILPGTTHVKVFLTIAQMPDGYGLEGTYIRTTLNFCKQSYVRGSYDYALQGLESILFANDVISYLD